MNNPNANWVVLNFTEEENILDVWKIMNENCKKMTWLRLNPVQKHARLDYFLVSETLFQYLTEADIIAGYKTDHNGITLQLKLIENSRRKWCWKFNNSLLQDVDYVYIVKQIIDEV